MFELDHTGRLSAPVLGLDLQAAGLTSEEAKACAAIVDLTRRASRKVPPFEQAADGWRDLADQAGALREERPTSATKVQRVKAPSYPSPPRSTSKQRRPPSRTSRPPPCCAEQVRVRSRRPTPRSTRSRRLVRRGAQATRLMLYGAVNAHASGKVAPAITKRKPYFVEMLAYLVLHPKGATGAAVADAFAVAPSRARTDLGTRRLAGHEPPNPAGIPHKRTSHRRSRRPECGLTKSRTCSATSMFRRLRTRGQARALTGRRPEDRDQPRTGVPFSNLRDKGWSWLLDTERLHETIGHAIVDTAHIVVVDAMAKGNLGGEAAETACTAAPHDDICRRPRKVAVAEGHGEAADQMLNDNVFNRTDDYLPPIIPEADGRCVGKEGWATTNVARPPDSGLRNPSARVFNLRTGDRLPRDLRKRRTEALRPSFVRPLKAASRTGEFWCFA